MQNKNFRFEEDPFAKNAQGVDKVYHEVLVLMKFLHTKPQVKNLNTNYHDSRYTVIKNRNEKEIGIGEDDENDYVNFSDIIPNHYIGRKNDNTILR